MNFKFRDYTNREHGWNYGLSEAYLSLNNAYYYYAEDHHDVFIIDDRYEATRIFFTNPDLRKFAIDLLEEFHKTLFPKKKELEVLDPAKLNGAPIKFVFEKIHDFDKFKGLLDDVDAKVKTDEFMLNAEKTFEFLIQMKQGEVDNALAFMRKAYICK